MNACKCTEFRNVQIKFLGFCSGRQQIQFVSQYNYKYAISSLFFWFHLCRQISRKVINLMDEKRRVEKLMTTRQAKQNIAKHRFQLCTDFQVDDNDDLKQLLLFECWHAKMHRDKVIECKAQSFVLLILLANLCFHWKFHYAIQMQNVIRKKANGTRSNGFLA